MKYCCKCIKDVKRNSSYGIYSESDIEYVNRQNDEVFKIEKPVTVFQGDSLCMSCLLDVL